jgi:hypothetical protein
MEGATMERLVVISLSENMEEDTDEDNNTHDPENIVDVSAEVVADFSEKTCPICHDDMQGNI